MKESIETLNKKLLVKTANYI